MNEIDDNSEGFVLLVGEESPLPVCEKSSETESHIMSETLRGDSDLLPFRPEIVKDDEDDEEEALSLPRFC